MHWDVFCRVIDNFGDVGVCWRLASDLVDRGHQVRLFIDDANALAWMAPPHGRSGAGVSVLRWHASETIDEVADVVIEAFGCELPQAYLEHMASRAATSLAPAWINLEYLSAEADVERSHGLPSPQMSGPAAGLQKWFFYPGFTRRTGGLLREQTLMHDRASFDGRSWLVAHGIERGPHEMIASVFAYDVEALGDLLAAIAPRPMLLLAAGGAARQVSAAVEHLAHVRVKPLAWFSQPEYDRLLWACDLNLVRGEDSFVRAQWAGRPFIWQIYPQHDGVHRIKLEAFLDRFLSAAPTDMSSTIRHAWMRWNGLHGRPGVGALPTGMLKGWRRWCEHWRDELLAQSDLSSQLIDFVSERR